MTNREIKRYKKNLITIGNQSDYMKKRSELKKMAKQLGTFIFAEARAEPPTLYLNIHTHLQSEMMFNACVSSKQSCFWAAIAAIAACTTVVVSNWSTLQEWVLVLKDCLF